MKLLAFLGFVLLVAIVFGIIDINPALTAITEGPSIPWEGLKIIARFF